MCSIYLIIHKILKTKHKYIEYIDKYIFVYIWKIYCVELNC